MQRLIYNWFINTYIDRGWVMWTVAALTIIPLILTLPVGWKHRKNVKPIRRWKNQGKNKGGERTYTWYWVLLAQIGVTLLGFAVGWWIVWLLSDVYVAFGVGLGRKVFIRVALGVAAVGYALVSVRVHSGWRKKIAIFMIPMAMLFSGLQVNAAYGQYPTVREVLGIEHFAEASSFPRATVTVEQYLQSVKSGGITVGEHGKINSVHIPATKSGFRARAAVVYLPPAALTKDVPELPVLVILSGQPGNPDTFFTAGGMGRIADNYAKTHNGLAPVIISPDHLGNRFHNTLCADTQVYGKTETYLMDDVMPWIENNLPVTQNHKDWGIAGFSQGGTCTVQLAPTYPNVFHFVIDVAGERGPHAGSEENMINRFFGGNKSAYEAHLPVNTFSRHAPSDQTIIFGAGELDTIGQGNSVEVSTYAVRAGWKVQSVLVPDAGHDWEAVRGVMEYGLSEFGYDTGLGAREPRSRFASLRQIPGVQTSKGSTASKPSHGESKGA